MIFITPIDQILSELNTSINNKIPFSLIRFGDGGLKFMNCLLNDDDYMLNIICKKEGIPLRKVLFIMDKWSYYARKANYIDNPEVYFTNNFWPRIKGRYKPIHEKTRILLMNWKKYYHNFEFDNNKYCNPEVNFLLCLRREEKQNLLDIIKNKRICFICTDEKISDLFKEYCYIECLKIVGQNQGQYIKNFNFVMETIKNRSNFFDLWIVCAGEIGRIYSGFIKECGGRSLDMGFVFEYWINKIIPGRLKCFMKPNIENELELVLTDLGLKFKDKI